MTENKKYYTEMTLDEFRVAMGTDSNLHAEVKGDDWEIWRDDDTERFFYVDLGEETEHKFHEVEVVARLTYTNELNMECDIDVLVDMFDDFDYVGQIVNSVANTRNITYKWFRIKR